MGLRGLARSLCVGSIVAGVFAISSCGSRDDLRDFTQPLPTQTAGFGGAAGAAGAGGAIGGAGGSAGQTGIGGAGGVGGGIAGAGGAGGGIGGAAGLDGGAPDAGARGRINADTVPGGAFMKSNRYRMIGTVGQSPGANTVKSSAKYKMFDGVVGSTQ